MEKYFDYIVKDINLEDLTLRKITNKFIKEHFDLENIMDIFLEQEKIEFEKIPSSKEITDLTQIPFQSLLMSQEMTVSLWLGFVQNMIKGDFIKAVVNQQGQIFIQSYNKTPIQNFQSEIPSLSENDIIDGIKTALKNRLKSSTD